MDKGKELPVKKDKIPPGFPLAAASLVSKAGFIQDLKRRALSILNTGKWEGLTEGAQSVIECSTI